MRPEKASPEEIEFRENGGGLFEKIEALCAAVEEKGFRVDPAELKEFFRLAHTFKGNAAMFGFEKASEFAHVIEDFLQGDRSNRQGGKDISVDECRFLCWSMLELVRSTKEAGRPKEGDATPKLNAFFLHVEFERKHYLIPGPAVAEVVYKPQVLRLPESRQVIRTKNGWAALQDLGFFLRDKRSLCLLSSVQWAIVLTNGQAYSVDEVVEMLEFPYLPARRSESAPEPTSMTVLPIWRDLKAS